MAFHALSEGSLEAGLRMEKDKKRAKRRKRNLLARELRLNKALLPKVVELKTKKEPKIRVTNIEEFLEDGGFAYDD